MRRILDALALLGIGAFAILGLAFPLAGLGHEFFHHFSGLWDPEILDAVRVTVLQASVSAVVSSLLGVLIALILPRGGQTGSRPVRALLGVPFGIPAVAAATAWVLCLPRAITYSLTAVIVAHVFFNAPWVTLWVSRALDDIPASQTEVARTLGAARAGVFRWVELPVIAPALGSAFAQVFSFCAMSFILVMILGGGPPVDTLETTLFARIRTGGLDLPGAGACAIWQIAITLLPWLLVRSTRRTRRLGGRRDPGVRRSSRARAALGIALATVFLAPYLVLLARAPLGSLFAPGAERAEGAQMLRAFGVSAGIAAGTAGISAVVAVLGIWAEERSRLFARLGSPALVLPAGISVMVLGLGFFIVYGSYLDPFSPSLWPIIFLQSMLFTPIAFRALQPVARSRNLSAWGAAQVLGASPWKAFCWVEWPRWRGPLAGVLALVAGAAFGEVAAVSLFYNEGRIPASLLISRWMGQYRFEEAQALSVLLMLAAGFLILSGMWVGFAEEVRHG